MNIRKALSAATVTRNLSGSNKQEVISALVDLACRTGKVKDRDAALLAVLERERKMTTGLEHGVAIPHGKTAAVEELVACFGITPEEIDFVALDGKPSRIFVMTLSPVDRTGPHIQFLAEISQMLKRPERRAALLAAATDEELLRLLLQG